MLDHRPAVRFYEMFGGAIYSKKQRAGYEPCVQWNADRVRAAKVLRVLRPFLVSKVEVVDICLEYVDTVLAKRPMHKAWTAEEAAKAEALRLRLFALHHPNRGGRPKPVPSADQPPG